MISEDLQQHFRRLPAKRREELRSDWEHYESACHLAGGSDPGRSKHWRQEAAIRGNRLSEKMGITPKAKRRNRTS